MRVIYSLVIYLGSPFLMLYVLWRTRKTHDYRGRWRELLGVFTAPAKTGGICLHAASLGEVNAAIPLIKALLAQYPEQTLTVTTMTKTGSMRIHDVFADRVFHVYAPLDFPGAVKRFLKSLKPQLMIFMETELWPNKIMYCAKRKIPILLANARLSKNSVKHYHRYRRFVT